MRKKLFLIFLFLFILSIPNAHAEELTGHTNTACVYNGGYSVINYNGTITGSFAAPNGVNTTCKVNYNYVKSGCPLYMNIFVPCPMGTCNCDVSFSEQEKNNSRKLTEQTEGCSFTTKSGMKITMVKSGSTWNVKSDQNVTLSVNDNVKNATSCPKKIYVRETSYGASKTYLVSLTTITNENQGGIEADGSNDEKNDKEEEKPKQEEESKPIPVTDTDVSKLCESDNLKKPLKYVGWILTAAKVIIPILIIVFGALDFFKVMVSNKSDEIPKAVKSLVMRVIAGIVIFFIPAIIHFLFALLDDWNDYKSDYSECTKCLYDPKSC